MTNCDTKRMPASRDDGVPDGSDVRILLGLVGIPIQNVRPSSGTLGRKPIRVSAQDVEKRLLRLQTPFMQGEDVRKQIKGG